MLLLINNLIEGYDYLFIKLSDPRSNDWPLIKSPIPGLVILGLYLHFVLKSGPRWMKNRPAFNLKGVMMAYNAFQVVACVYLVYGGYRDAWGKHYKLVCQGVDPGSDDNTMRIITYVYWYFLMKITDLIDTIFFVLRKKNNQITFLHVYHHTGMVMLCWAGVKYYPGGHGTMLGMINSVIHAIMYAYYFITIALPGYREPLMKWKKIITQLQIIQFLTLFVHFLPLVFKQDCEYPRWIALVFLPQNLFMLILFIDFYIKAYIRKPVKKGKPHPQLKDEDSITLQDSKAVDTNSLEVKDRKETDIIEDLKPKSDKYDVNENVFKATIDNSNKDALHNDNTNYDEKSKND